jgi:hypothetical protein
MEKKRFIKTKQFYYTKNVTNIRRKQKLSNRVKKSNKKIQNLNTQLFKIHVLNIFFQHYLYKLISIFSPPDNWKGNNAGQKDTQERSKCSSILFFLLVYEWSHFAQRENLFPFNFFLLFKKGYILLRKFSK